jgi:hypothetical protein
LLSADHRNSGGEVFQVKLLKDIDDTARGTVKFNGKKTRITCSR